MVVHDGPEAEIPIKASMPGRTARLSQVARAAAAAKEARALGIPAIAVFPFIDGEEKKGRARQATLRRHDPDGLVVRVRSRP